MSHLEWDRRGKVSPNGIRYHYAGTKRALEADHILVAVRDCHGPSSVTDWLTANMGEYDGKRWVYQEDHDNLMLFTFREPNDALLFKLSWT